MKAEYSLLDVFIYGLATWAVCTIFDGIWPLHHPVLVGIANLVTVAGLFIWCRYKFPTHREHS